MCTVVILRRPGHDWPVMIAANRDEMTDRPWDAPARHWPDRSHVIAGRDRLAGGTWMGLNDFGVFAGVLNRMNTLGPADDKRSRGELPLEALDHAEARAAAEALGDLDPASYKGFNMIIADAVDAYWLRSTGKPGSRVETTPIPPGLSMVTAFDMNDAQASARTRAYLPRFRAAPPPDPSDDADGDGKAGGSDTWFAWESLLASRLYDPADGPGGAMCVVMDGGFETVSSSLVALRAAGATLGPAHLRARWRFCPGRPDRCAFETLDL
jgi:hypothetical protein